MEQQMVLAVLVGILVLVSAFQAIQLAELSGRVQGLGLGSGQGIAYAPSSVQTQQSSTGGQQAQPASGAASAPNMVGGC